MADTAGVQLCDQLIQELEEVLGELLSQRKSCALDPLPKEDISPLRHKPITSCAPCPLVYDGGGDITQAFKTLEGALLSPR